MTSTELQWICDLQRYDESFPAVDLAQLSVEDREQLARYLEFDDGSLTPGAMQFSRDVAREVRKGDLI